MCADLLLIDPKRGFVVAGTDMKQYVLAIPFRGNFELLAVPYTVTKIGISNARELTFAAEGNLDPFGEIGFGKIKLTVGAGQGAVGAVFPCAVEVDPVGAYHLWTRVFGSEHGVVSFSYFKKSLRRADQPLLIFAYIYYNAFATKKQ